MTMTKLALVLLLALSGADTFASTGARSLPPRGLMVDGVNRRVTVAARRRSVRRKVSAPVAAAAAAVRPVVTEIDGDGLKKLLQRGEAGAGARPLLLNFWATWCGPCRKEFPDLVKIDAEYRGRDLEFVTVSADDVSELKTGVPKFLRQMRATAMPAYLLNATDTETAIAQVDPAWRGELPATFLFDRQGILVYKHTGLIDAAELREALDKVIGERR